MHCKDYAIQPEKKHNHSPMKKVLFICHGNICRSPMAEYVFRDMVAKDGLTEKIGTASAATSNEEIGNPIYPPVRELLNSHGIKCDGKRARRIVASDYEEYDYLVAMDRNNLRNMRPVFWEDPKGKITLLLDHTDSTNTAFHGRDVLDPWYTRDFEATWQDIQTGCRSLLEEIKKTL